MYKICFLSDHMGTMIKDSCCRAVAYCKAGGGFNYLTVQLSIVDFSTKEDGWNTFMRSTLNNPCPHLDQTAPAVRVLEAPDLDEPQPQSS